MRNIVALLICVTLTFPSVFATDFGNRDSRKWTCHFQGKSADSIVGVTTGSEYTVNAFGVGYIENEARDEAEKECSSRSYQICVEMKCTAPTECDGNFMEGSPNPEERGKKAAYLACKSSASAQKFKVKANEAKALLKAKIAATNGGEEKLRLLEKKKTAEQIAFETSRLTNELNDLLVRGTPTLEKFHKEYAASYSKAVEYLQSVNVQSDSKTWQQWKEFQVNVMKVVFDETSSSSAYHANLAFYAQSLQVTLERFAPVFQNIFPLAQTHGLNIPNLEEKIGALKTPFLKAALQAKERNKAVSINGRKAIDILQKRIDFLLSKEQSAIHKKHNAGGDYMQVSTEFARLARKKIEPVVAFQQGFVMKPNSFFQYSSSLEELEYFAKQCADYGTPKGKPWMDTGCVASQTEIQSSKQIADGNMRLKIRMLLNSKKCNSVSVFNIQEVKNKIELKLKNPQTLQNLVGLGEQLLAFGCRGEEK